MQIQKSIKQTILTKIIKNRIFAVLKFEYFMANKIKFIEVNSELAAGTRGASLGIGAVKTASLNKKMIFSSIMNL